MSLPHRTAPTRSPAPGRRAGEVHVIGVADVGSNSTHLLVAATDGERIEQILDVSVPIDLGGAIMRRGEIGKALAARVAASLVDFRERARALGAEGIAVVGTEPLRRADDRVEVSRRIAARYGTAIAALSHEEEGHLALLGLRHAHDWARSHVVADIGGGSTEVVLLAPGRAPKVVGMPIGSATLGGGEELGDPPRSREWQGLRERAEAALSTRGALHAQCLVLAGGTAQGLLRLVPAALVDRRIVIGDLVAMRERLSISPAARIAVAHGISTRRARLLPSGLTVVEALMGLVGVESARVDRGGIREGLLVAIAQAGSGWREELPRLALRRIGG